MIDITTFKEIQRLKGSLYLKNLCVYKNKLFSSNFNMINMWDLSLKFKPIRSYFNILSNKDKDIIKLVCYIRERYDVLEYGLPPELWYHILEFY